MKTGWAGPTLTLLAGVALTLTAVFAGRDALGETLHPLMFYAGIGLALGGLLALAGWALGKWGPSL